MRNQILQRCEHIMHPKEERFHDSLCVLYQSIFFIIVFYSMSTLAPYKPSKQEKTIEKHSRNRMEKYTIKGSSFSRRPIDHKLSRHNLDPLPY